MNWISVKDRLPEFDVNVLLFHQYTYLDSCDPPGMHHGENIFVGHFEYIDSTGSFFRVGKCRYMAKLKNNADDHITHWMPLPDPPGEGG